jgi:hypothetical protein
MAAVSPSSGLDPKTVHALSNHVSVILGFIELVLADTPPEHPHHRDLVEIRDAAVHAAALITGPTEPRP